MRNAILSLVLICAGPAFAETGPKRPEESPPAASAPFEARENWCQKYADWFVSVTPTPAPSDVRPTQRFENELASCKIDPQAYQRETLAEVAGIVPG